jgi:hypothetical protein
MLAVGLSYIAFIMLRYFPSIPSFLRAFIMKCCLIIIDIFEFWVRIFQGKNREGAFQTEQMPWAKALRQEGVWHIQESED